jgi:hypothetical protein
MLSVTLGVIDKSKTLEEAVELTDGEKQYFSFGRKLVVNKFNVMSNISSYFQNYT